LLEASRGCLGIKFYSGKGRAPGALGIPRWSTLCLRMLETMRAYHEAGYVHGDIKCANWCFKDATDSTLQVQLIDYGVCLIASCSMKTTGVSVHICKSLRVAPCRLCHLRKVSS
jgi:hypothetical protein